MTETTGRLLGLHAHPAYRPDCGALARRQFALARTQTGMSVTEFAARLTASLGWPVTPEVVEAWETRAVPSGDALIAADLVGRRGSDSPVLAGIRSHKFVAAHIGDANIARLVEYSTMPVDHVSGRCQLHLFPFGVAVFHLVEDLRLQNLATLATWRIRTYEENLAWATERLIAETGDDTLSASYVLSLYWMHKPIWEGRALDTALRIACSPRVLLERNVDDSGLCQQHAEDVELTLLTDGFEHAELQSFGVDGVSAGYASWSGVAYHPIDPERALAEDDVIACELATQSMWAYCEYINGRVEDGVAPIVPERYGWRFLRGAKSRLINPRGQETGQHRSMRDAIIETSGLGEHITQAIEALRDSER